MARKLIVEIVGDTASLQKSYRNAERGTRRFGQSVEKAGRGAVVASVGFKGLGRSVAFASSAFIGGAGLTYAITSSVKAAEESQRVTEQTKVALEDTGKSWGRYGKQIQAAATATSNLSGFDDERLLGTFTLFERRTHDVTEALRENAIAADVARGRNISLEAAAALVNKAGLGMAGSLRRVGIAAKDGSSSVELLDLLSRKFAGSAEAYGKTAAGAQDRFRVALENVEEIIGGALLPDLTKVLDKATKWLSNTENQKKIQDISNESVHKGSVAVTNLRNAYNDVKTVWGALSKIPDPFGLGHLAAMTNMNARLGELAANAAKLRGEWEKLSKELTGPPIAALKQLASAFDSFKATMLTDAALVQTAMQNLFAPPANQSYVTASQLRAIGLARTGGTGTAAEVAAINAQLAVDNKAIAYANKRIANGRGNLKAFGDQLISLEGDRRSMLDRLAAISSANAAAAKDARDKIKAANEARRQALLDIIGEGAHGAASLPGLQSLITARIRRLGAPAREQAKVFQLLGLTAGGDTRGPSQGNLQAALKSAQTAVAGGPLDSKALQSRLAGLRTVINSEFGKLTRDTKTKISEFLDALAGKKTGGPATPQRAASIAGLIAGTGLTGAGLRQLEFNLAGAHLTTGVRGANVDARPIVINLDGTEIARVSRGHDERDKRRRPTQTRGRQLP